MNRLTLFIWKWPNRSWKDCKPAALNFVLPVFYWCLFLYIHKNYTDSWFRLAEKSFLPVQYVSHWAIRTATAVRIFGAGRNLPFVYRGFWILSLSLISYTCTVDYLQGVGYYTVPSENIHTPWLFPHFCCHVFLNLCKFIKNEKLKCLESISIQPLCYNKPK